MSILPSFYDPMSAKVQNCFAILLSESQLATLAADPRPLTWIELANRARWWRASSDNFEILSAAELVDIFFDWLWTESLVRIKFNRETKNWRRSRADWRLTLGQRLEEGGYHIQLFYSGATNSILEGIDKLKLDQKQFTSIVKNYEPGIEFPTSDVAEAYEFIRDALSEAREAIDHALLIISEETK